MSTLYVIEPGARLEKEYQRLAVTKDDELLQRVPLAQLSEVVLVGAVGVTTPAMIALLEAGVPLSIIRSSGQLLGRLTPPPSATFPCATSSTAAPATRPSAFKSVRPSWPANCATSAPWCGASAGRGPQ